MKATLEFNLPEEKAEHLCSVKGQAIAFAVWEFLYNGHRELKHHDPNNLFDGFREAQKKLGELLEEEGVLIDDLVR